MPILGQVIRVWDIKGVCFPDSMLRFGQKAQRKVCGFLGPLFGSYIQELQDGIKKWERPYWEAPSGKEKWEGDCF